MPAIKDLNDAILTRLQSLMMTACPTLLGVSVDPIGSLRVPCGVIFDEGLASDRDAQMQLLALDLKIQIFVAGIASGDLAIVSKRARDYRGDLINALDLDIALGAVAATGVQRTRYASPVMAPARLEYEGNFYLGVDCPYRIYIDGGTPYA